MRLLVILPAARGVYPDEAAQRRIDRIRSYSRPGLEVEVDYPAEKSGFNPYGGEGKASKQDAHIVCQLVLSQRAASRTTNFWPVFAI